MTDISASSIDANKRNLGQKTLNYPTDYNLKTLNLVTPISGPDGVINLMPFFLELNLFEDLYGSTISGEILLQDALGLISNFKMNGTEFLTVQLQKTSEQEIFYSRTFRVYKVGKRIISDSNQYEVFSLMFCSEEFLLSEQYRISKSFKGKQISNIVEEIFQNYLKIGKNQNDSTKPVYIENTLGTYDFVLPNKKIFDTVNWLSTYAQGQRSKGDFIFFENSDGYYFASLTTLFQEGVYGNYTFDPKNISTDANQQIFNVSDFEVLDFYDTLAGISNGAFSNKVISLNVLQRQANVSAGIFSYANYNPTLNPYGVINNYENRLGGTMYDGVPPVSGLEAGCLRMVAGNKEDKMNPGILARNSQDSVANDIMIERYLPNRVARLALANYTRIKFNIPGDPNMTVGKVVNFRTFQIGDSNNRVTDPFYSGKYIVSAVRHVIKNTSYITVVELCKDSNLAPVAGFNNNEVVLGSFVDGIQPREGNVTAAEYQPSTVGG